MIPKLEAACGFVFPRRLELVAEAWFRHETPGGWCSIHGRTTRAPDDGGAWTVAVQVPVSILAPGHSEARIIAVLLHEWLHALRFLIDAVRPDEDRIVDGDAWAQYPTGPGYARLDAAMRVDPSDWLQMEAWRIVSDDLWNSVASRRDDVAGRAIRFSSGRMSGRPPIHATKNLLAGIATCGVCGGGLVVETSGPKNGRVPEYVCHRRRPHRDLCTNTLRVSVDVINEAVLQVIEEHALTPEAVEHVVQLTERDDLRDRHETLAQERDDVDKRIARLVAAIEAGGDAPSLVAKVRELEARRADTIAGLQPLPRLAPQVVADHLAVWRRLLRGSTTQGRAVLQRAAWPHYVHATHRRDVGLRLQRPDEVR